MEEATGEGLGGAAVAPWEVREKGALPTGSTGWGGGVGPGEAATTHCSPTCKFHRGLWSLGDPLLWGMERRQRKVQECFQEGECASVIIP